MRSPVLSMLWENWRLIRREAAQRLAQGIVLPAAVLVGFAAFGPDENQAVRLALAVLVLNGMPLWLSVAKLNGGRFGDGYRPGYPFYFLYTRPIRTFVLVGVPMAYLAATVAAAYIVSALVLRATFGYPFPLVPLAVLIAAFHIAQWAAQWGTSNKVVQWAGSLTAGLGFTVLGMWHAREWPARFDFSIGDYALLATIGVASFGLTVAGVARQRRGDAQAFSPRTVTRSGFWDWLADLFQIPCPTASATRAQVWFELKSSGLPVLVIGLALAIAIPLLLVVAIQIDVVLSWSYPRPAGLAGPASLAAAMVVALFSLPAVLLLGGNAFGIRARQGRTYASAFEATQACGTARMAGLNVLMRSVCLLAGLVAVGVSVWASLSLIAVVGGAPLRRYEPFRSWQRAIKGTVGPMSAYELLALAFVTVIAVVVIVAARAALAALRARYRQRVNIALSLLLLHGFVLVLLALAAQRGFGVEALTDAVFGTTRGVATAAIVLATVYLLSRVLVDRLLTLRSASLAVLVSAAFAAAWVTVLSAAGVSLAAMPATDAVWTLLPVLLPLTASVLAPWSLSRIRHT